MGLISDMDSSSKPSSECITEGIRIRVFPEYIPPEFAPGRDKNYFSYIVVISNEGDKWAKLLSRHWIIINSEGEREEVIGEGVVGYFPELKPGDTFTYKSFCPIETDWATMEGSYQMIRDDNTIFEAKIERFFLLSPDILEKG